MDIESQRLENLRQKQKLLADLNLQSKPVTTRVKVETDARPPPSKKRRLQIPSAPSRTSARLASGGAKPSYKEDGGERWTYVDPPEPRSSRRTTRRGGSSRKHETVDNTLTPNDLRSLVPVADVDSIRAGWASWEAVAQPPTRDEYATFHFEDYPTFTPNKSPEEMLREGSFGGAYFRPLKSRKLGIVVEDDWKELPGSWTEGLDVNKYLISTIYDPEANKFKVSCGQSIEEWEAAGWIAHEFDVRGWFQWYCRFWQGRRCDDDDRQVSRWAKCVGARGRWRRLLLKKYVQMGVKDVFDHGDEEDEEGNSTEVSPVMHQTCHHWAYEVRQGDLDEAWTEFR